MFLYYVDRPLFWFFVLFSNSEIARFSVLVPCRHEVLWYSRFRNSAKTTFNLYTRTLHLHFSGAVRTLPFPHSGENAAKNRASVLVRPQAWGQRVGNARAARHTLVYGPPTGLPFCSLCVRLFFYLPLLARFSSSPSRPRRSLHGWPGRGRNCGRWLGLPALLAARLPGSSALRDDAGTFVLRADCSPFSLRYSTREWAGLIR